jgi:hypothetical protein
MGSHTIATGRMIEMTVTAWLPVEARGTAAYARPHNNAAWGPILEKALIGLARLRNSGTRAEWQSNYRVRIEMARYEWLETASPEARARVEPLLDDMTAVPPGFPEIGAANDIMDRAELLTAVTGTVAAISVLSGQGIDPDEVRTEIEQLLRADCPIVLGTYRAVDYESLKWNGQPVGRNLPYGLMSDHGYELVSIDDDGMVELDNPWGFQHPRKIPFKDLVVLMHPEFVHLELPSGEQEDEA